MTAYCILLSSVFLGCLLDSTSGQFPAHAHAYLPQLLFSHLLLPVYLQQVYPWALRQIQSLSHLRIRTLSLLLWIDVAQTEQSPLSGQQSSVMSQQTDTHTKRLACTQTCKQSTPHASRMKQHWHAACYHLHFSFAQSIYVYTGNTGEQTKVEVSQTWSLRDAPNPGINY